MSSFVWIKCCLCWERLSTLHAREIPSWKFENKKTYIKLSEVKAVSRRLSRRFWSAEGWKEVISIQTPSLTQGQIDHYSFSFFFERIIQKINYTVTHLNSKWSIRATRTCPAVWRVTYIHVEHWCASGVRRVRQTASRRFYTGWR